MAIQYAEDTAPKPQKKRGIADLSVGRQDLLKIDLDLLQVKPSWNCRDYDFSPDDEEDLRLAHSIARNGVIEPLTVVYENETIFVTNGHRRRAAALYARDNLGSSVKRVPVQVEPRGNDPAENNFSQWERNSGKGYKPHENGKLFKQQLALGWTMEELVGRTRLTKAYILSLIDLLAAPKALELVRADTVTATEAMRVLREEGRDAERAEERIREGEIVARAAGKSRVTRKHLSPKSPPDLTKSVGWQAGVKWAVETLRTAGMEEASKVLEGSRDG